jgi:hypothetical protein
MTSSAAVFAHPESAEEAFYGAFATLDLAGMGAVWVQEQRPFCVHPGGDLLEGRRAVLESWREIFSGSEPPAIEHRLLGSFQSGDLAIHLVEEMIQPRRSGGQANRVLATNVYVREADCWRIAEHHASLPLVARQGKGTAQGKNLVH